MHSFAIRVRAEKQKQKQTEGIKPSPAALAAAKKKLAHQQGVKKPKANGVKKSSSNKPNNPSNKQGKKKKTALPEITYHVATTRPAWADEPGERYGAYNRFLQAQKLKATKEKEKPSTPIEQNKKSMKGNHSKALSAHRRWLKKNNKVQDVSQEATKDTEAKEKEPPKESNGAAIVLYVGVGLIVIGLIMTFVGMGEDGFRTIELKLVGPSLIGMGIFFCLLRILSCAFADYFARKCPCCCKKPPSKDTDNATNSPAKEDSTRSETTADTPQTERIKDAQEPTPVADTHAATSSTKPPGTAGYPSSDVIMFVNEATTRATVGHGATGVGKLELATNRDIDEWYSEFEEVKLSNPTRTINKNNELILNPNKLMR